MSFEIHPSSNQQYFFRIVASNGQILAHSETYTTKANAIHAAELIQSQANGAEIIDFT